MFTFVPLVLLLIGGLAWAIFAKPVTTGKVREWRDDKGMRRSEAVTKSVRWFGLAVAGVALLVMGLTSITRVKDGHVAGVSTFGVYSDTTLKPGLNVIAPWQSTTKLDGRLQCRKYGFPAASGTDSETQPFSTAVSAQAKGGGNLVIDMSVCTQADPDKAVSLLREIGPDYISVLLSTKPRSCLRDAAKETTVDEAIGEKRSELGLATLECTNLFTQPRGLNVVDVQISDVDPGDAVKRSIDAKEQAEKEVQLAETKLRQASIDAQAQAVEAFGISQAEQIVACGGSEQVETITGVDGAETDITTITPNDECEDQFSEEYLQWLMIGQLDKINGLVILPSDVGDNLILSVPEVAPALQGGSQ